MTGTSHSAGYAWGVHLISALGGARYALAPEYSPSLKVRLDLTAPGPRASSGSCARLRRKSCPCANLGKGSG